MLKFLINGELMTIEDYMERHQVTYLRAIHEMNAHMNRAVLEPPTLFADRAGAPTTAKKTAGDIGNATDRKRDADEG